MLHPVAGRFFDKILNFQCFISIFRVGNGVGQTLTIKLDERMDTVARRPCRQGR
jgi:hypothetical protein